MAVQHSDVRTDDNVRSREGQMWSRLGAIPRSGHSRLADYNGPPSHAVREAGRVGPGRRRVRQRRRNADGREVGSIVGTVVQQRKIRLPSSPCSRRPSREIDPESHPRNVIPTKGSFRTRGRRSDALTSSPAGDRQPLLQLRALTRFPGGMPRRREPRAAAGEVVALLGANATASTR